MHLLIVYFNVKRQALQHTPIYKSNCLTSIEQSLHLDDEQLSNITHSPKEGKWRSSLPLIFNKRRQSEKSSKKQEPSSSPALRSQKVLERLEDSKFSNIPKLIDKLQPTAKPNFDEYQEQFPPKAFLTPKQTWYRIPTRDDGSHSWPLTETWPPQFIVDLKKHVPLFMAMIVAVVLPISLVQRYAYPATQKVGNRPGYDCM